MCISEACLVEDVEGTENNEPLSQYSLTMTPELLNMRMRLSSKRRLAAEWYVITGNKRESFLRAGYSESHTGEYKFSEVQLAYLSALVELLPKLSPVICTAIERQLILSDVIRDDSKDWKERYDSIEMMNKMQHTYIQRVVDETIRPPSHITVEITES